MNGDDARGRLRLRHLATRRLRHPALNVVHLVTLVDDSDVSQRWTWASQARGEAWDSLRQHARAREVDDDGACGCRQHDTQHADDQHGLSVPPFRAVLSPLLHYCAKHHGGKSGLKNKFFFRDSSTCKMPLIIISIILVTRSYIYVINVRIITSLLLLREIF